MPRPVSFTLVAMRNLPIFSVSPVAVFAAEVAAADSGVVASRLAVGLLELPVRFFVRAMSSGVPRSSLSRSPLRLALSVLGVAVFFLGLLHSVAVSASNMALNRSAVIMRFYFSAFRAAPG